MKKLQRNFMQERDRQRHEYTEHVSLIWGQRKEVAQVGGVPRNNSHGGEGGGHYSLQAPIILASLSFPAHPIYNLNEILFHLHVINGTLTTHLIVTLIKYIKPFNYLQKPSWHALMDCFLPALLDSLNSTTILFLGSSVMPSREDSHVVALSKREYISRLIKLEIFICQC